MKRFRIVISCFGILFFGNSTIMAAAFGQITIITEPSGVEVWLGGRYIGNSPVREKLIPSGKHELKLIDPFQKISVTEEVMVEDGKEVIIEKKIKPKYGTLKVESVPDMAEVYLTVPLGKTPLKSEFIIPGKYQLEIRSTDRLYKVSERQVVVFEGETSELSDTLSKVNKKFELNKKAFVRIGLGVGAVAGFIWAVIENGDNNFYEAEGLPDKAQAAGIRRNIGLIGGAVCVVAFEIVAFF